MLRRCTEIPTDRFPVTDDMLLGLLDRTRRLADEARVILLDYPTFIYLLVGLFVSRITQKVTGRFD